MLNAGEKAPDFALENDKGEEVTLGGLLESGPLILYFYPADFTPGCTAEACSIRDIHTDIQSVGLQVAGEWTRPVVGPYTAWDQEPEARGSSQEPGYVTGGKLLPFTPPGRLPMDPSGVRRARTIGR